MSKMVIIYGKVKISNSDIKSATPNIKQMIYHPTYAFPEGDIAVVEVGVTFPTINMKPRHVFS